MANEVVSQTRYIGGLEAPRNSLELPAESSYDIYSLRDNILYAHHLNKESSNKSYYSNEAPIKNLISEEIFQKPKTRQNTPSVVARLMGVDTLPFNSKIASQLDDIKSEIISVGHELSFSNSLHQQDFAPFGYNTDRYSDQYSSYTKPNKPKPREHPQEEELQKFKKEFEAWQTARFNQCSKIIEFGSAPSQLIAQEDLHREKMLLTVNNSKRVTTNERFMELGDLAVTSGSKKVLTSPISEKKNEFFLDEVKNFQLINIDKKPDIVSGPTKIVVLRPGPDKMDFSEDSWNSTPSISEERGSSIKDFLEEVKERLKSELEGKKSTYVRGRGIETPYWEKPTEPKQIAKRIAQQVRDSVTEDLGMNLLRSESTRSYKSEIQLDGIDSPEFITKNTRKFLTEKLRNVLKVEDPLVSNNSSRSSVSDFKTGRAEQLGNIRIKQKMDYLDSNFFESEKQSRVLRHESNEMSPMSLIRSWSAPVTRTSFGKLLLEDRHILTGAEIRRKHEVIKRVPVNVKKQKDKFNIREKVSSFRYNSLTLSRKLFHRRVQSLDGSRKNKHDFFNDISSGPTVIMNFYGTNENSTEVPPSPASVCSTPHEDFWRSTDYSSPTSSSGVYPMEDNEMPHGFREINSNLNELRRKLNQFEGDFLADTTIKQQPDELEVDIEDQVEAYIRDLLVASGLYNGSCNRSLSKWDPLGKHISNQVFEEVEESYKQITEICEKGQGEKLNHQILLDLLNEVLPAILKPPMKMEKAIGHVHKTLYGRNLLFRVWEIIKVYVYPPADRLYYALDSVFTRDLKSDAWSGLMEDDMNALARDFEGQIIGDLIEEIFKDMQS